MVYRLLVVIASVSHQDLDTIFCLLYLEEPTIRYDTVRTSGESRIRYWVRYYYLCGLTGLIGVRAQHRREDQ
jgi:hypothetical protein